MLNIYFKYFYTVGRNFGLCLFLISSIFASNAGKIFGKVTDSDTNEPLIGVNVVIKSTGQGASTDVEGEFYLIGVLPGKYDVVFSYIGSVSYTHLTLPTILLV